MTSSEMLLTADADCLETMPHTSLADRGHAERCYDEQITAAVRHTDDPLSGDELLDASEEHAGLDTRYDSTVYLIDRRRIKIAGLL